MAVIGVLFITAIVLWFNLTHAGQKHGYKLNVLGGLDACNAQKCGERPHTSCLTAPVPNCPNFELIVLSRKMLRLLIYGHNGIRNRVANSLLKGSANMNLLHWDMSLQRMASRWLSQCKTTKDDCDFIHNTSYSVGQNIFYLDKLEYAWIFRIIRKWYIEGNKVTPSVINKYTNQKMYDGIVLACNYYPKGNIEGEPVYRSGSACSNCEPSRRKCATKMFTGLCGMDGAVNDFSRSSKNVIKLKNLSIILIISIIHTFNPFLSH